MSDFRPDPILWQAPEGARRGLKSSFRAAFVNAVESHADREFLVCLGTKDRVRKATYRQFDHDVRIAAAQIHNLSRDGDIVVIVGPNHYETVVYITAALSTGRTLALMNPDEGPDRISQKCTLLQAPYVIWIDPDLRAWTWPQNELQTLNEFDLSSPSAAGPLPGGNFAAHQPCCLIFTSGSTGYSKVVEQTEIGLLTNIADLIERHGLRPGEVVATPLPIFHVNALEFALCCTLFSGAKLVLFERALLPLMLRGLQSEQCTILSIVPTVLKIFLERSADWRRLNLTNLRYIVTAAAPLSVELVLMTMERLRTRIIQGYGLSEAINFSCLMPVDLEEKDYLRWMTGFAWPSIGTPLRGSLVSVLDTNGRELPEAEVGEIAIRGPTVMKGYRGDHESSIFRDSYLHTGDLGLFHRDETGRRYFFISGRIKDTVKRNGMTISLREIDDLISQLDLKRLGVSDAITIAFPNDWSGEELAVAFSVAEGWNFNNEVRIKELLDQHFPAHLRPRVLLLTNRELRTPSGKPCRWRFAEKFGEFQNANLGIEICWRTEL